MTGFPPENGRGCKIMKKLLALLLAMVMVLSVATAMAADSKTTEDTTSVTTTKTNYTGGGKDKTPVTLMWKIELTDAAKELIEKLNEAKEAGDIRTVFPEELEVPADQIVADVISVAVDPLIAEETSYTAELTGIAGVAQGKAATLFALVDSTWFAANVKVPENNTIDVTFNHEPLEAMAPASNITLVVLTEKAE